MPLTGISASACPTDFGACRPRCTRRRSAARRICAAILSSARSRARHLVVGGRLGPDHRALGERGQLEVHRLVVLPRVGLAVDLDVDPDDPVIVLLQLRQLLTHVLPEPVRDLAVTTGDHNFHLNLP